jgi:hypothetical protein
MTSNSVTIDDGVRVEPGAVWSKWPDSLRPLIRTTCTSVDPDRFTAKVLIGDEVVLTTEAAKKNVAQSDAAKEFVARWANALRDSRP